MQIRKHGDFGLGTFNYLDGEMVLLDGNVYQIKSDGKAYSVGDDEQSPFACVTFFSPDTVDDVECDIDSADFYNFLNRLVPSPNMLYAIRIDGLFAHVKTRAVPKSENYRPLVEATKKQPVDRQHGGHLMECALKKVHIGIQHVPELEVGLPLTLDYLTADFTRDINEDLDRTEK